MENRKRGRQHVNTLLVILIGFCILAIIEIVYGQAQIRVEKERLALEQENSQTVQELREEWERLQNEAGVTTGREEQQTVGSAEITAETPVKTTEKAQDTQDAEKAQTKQPVTETTAKPQEEDDRQYSMQIVIMGDSIMDGDRTESGAADIISEQLGAKVYNMSIGGTTAALLPNDTYDTAKWTSCSLMGVINAIQGNISADVFDGYAAKEVLQTCDFSKTDYFIIEYGINDFLTGKIPNSRYLENGDMLPMEAIYTYTGALEMAVSDLRERFPNAQILLISPHYCQVFSGRTFIGDAYSLDYGYGNLLTFAQGTKYVAGRYKEDGVLFFDAFEYSGIDAETADEYLEDGVHMTPLGARVYAEKIASIIRRDFAPEE
ncbi:MAG: SGNH/GDSL hydrolase family protein [Bacteroidales bacterium]|nr:SGNH/GDSL hydrolase family protein [Bacteroidales bacterium]MCM1414488.1 SGNH/GDSL hydrolase family protein [bacterium]MCM1423750.1 SGNH/GDSL hydrolase family protein [bacterium]